MAITLTTTFQKVKETNIYTSGSYKAYMRIYAKLNSQDIENGQSSITIEKRFWYNQSTSSRYSFGSATSRAKIDTDSNWTTKTLGSTTYKGSTEYVIQTITRTINHLSDGASPVITISSTWTDTLGGSENTTVEIQAPKMDRYPTLIVAPSFNDEDNPTITYSTTIGFENVTTYAGIFSTQDNVLIDYRQVNIELGSYTFNLTQNERDTLLQSFRGVSPYQVKYKLKTTVGNTDYISEKTATFEVINDVPTITCSKYENNDVIRGLYGEPIIKNASNCNFTFIIDSLKFNDITSFYFTHNNSTIEIRPYTTDTGKEKRYTVFIMQVNIFSDTISYRYITSRGQDVANSITYSAYGEYTPVDITNVITARQSPTSDDVLIKDLLATVNGNINYSVGSQQYSESNSYVLSYKINNGNETVIPSNKYTITNNVLRLNNDSFKIEDGLPYTDNGNIEIKLVDLLSQDIENRSIKKGVATFDYGEHDFQVNGDLYVADTDRANAINILSAINTLALSREYNSTETMVGEWKGQTLYRKVIEQNLANNTNEQQISTGLVDGDLVFLENAFIENTSSGWIRPLMFFSSSNYYIQIESSVIKFKMYSATANLKLYAIILYTKV